MIDERTIGQILDRADIVDVVGSYVELKKRGASWEACCPFHQEKTPSFKVNPARGIWHCFGCQRGGDAIGFVMERETLTFPEAARLLARKYGIRVEEEEEPSPERERARAKRESMLVINRRCAEFFADRLKSAEGEAARAYAESRWGAEYVEEAGMGYAPRGWGALREFASRAGLSTELMLEMKLLKLKEGRDTPYDFYRDRLMIPIRDRYRRVIGFTARNLSGEEGVAKYLNSAESDVYSKGASIFGIDAAIRQAARDDKFYLVEGAPDVMRLQLIGANNAVASLGTAWTREQLAQLKKYATRLCFLPDADPPRRGEPYGTGVASVIKNGLLAMESGFAVSVREIPLGEGATKNDPDSYCTQRSRLDQLEEEDFITWYARYVFQSAETVEQKSAAVVTMCRLVASVGDEVKEAMYLTRLQEHYKNKSLWQSAINQARKGLKAKKVLEEGKKIDRDLYGKYGFYEDHDAYWSISSSGGSNVQWSNFTMRPMFHIKDALMPKRLYRIRNQNGQEDIIEMKQEDLVSITKFKQRVEGLGNYIWLATDKELTKLKLYLYENTETAVEITQLGWQHQGFYAFGNGAFDTEWHPADEYGIVRLRSGNYYLPGCGVVYRHEAKLFQFERRFVHTTFQNVSLREYAERLITVFGDNAKVGLCFLLATLFRDVITGLTKSFPILNLFGPKGSGKSELGHSLMSFFIIKNTPPNIQNATIAALGETVAQCANALVHVDEYKNSVDIDKREFLKGLWDGTGRSRMNMDRDKKREITAVDCGVILSGQEMPTIDIALFSRLIYLTFTKTEFSPAEKRAFDDCKEIRNRGLSHLTLQLLRHRAKVEVGFEAAYKQCLDDLNARLDGEPVEDRILRNWLIPLAAFRLLEGVIDLPFSYREMLEITTSGIVRQNRECKTNNELANFWYTVSFLLQDGAIFNRSDYRVDYVTRFKSNIVTHEIEYNSAQPILLLRKNRVFMLYKKFARQVGDTALPLESLRFYLENSKEYMGQKNSVRFLNVQNGVEVTQKVEHPGGRVEYHRTTTVDQAMCFDYKAIRKFYNVNLEVDTDSAFEDDGEAAREDSQAEFPF
ncbi:MAG: DNA primase [Mediterranea sp.]|jgi:DNA primase catalytic core|nr:DNA primase [Mediterranea sp.]